MDEMKGLNEQRDISSVRVVVIQLLSHVQLFETPWMVAHQAPLSMEFSRQEYWSGLPFPPPGDLPNPGIKPRSPALQADSLPSEPPGKPCEMNTILKFLRMMWEKSHPFILINNISTVETKPILHEKHQHFCVKQHKVQILKYYVFSHQNDQSNILNTFKNTGYFHTYM